MLRRTGTLVETKLHSQTPHPGRYFIIYARSPIVKQWCPMNIVSGSEAGDSPYTSFKATSKDILRWLYDTARVWWSGLLPNSLRSFVDKFLQPDPLPSQKGGFLGGGVGWDVNVHVHRHRFCHRSSTFTSHEVVLDDTSGKEW